MLPTVENSERFKTEFNDFRSRIGAITNLKVKEELGLQLSKLLREVRRIDEQHQDLFMKRQELPSLSTEIRSNITELRRSIKSRLDDWDRSQSTNS